MPATSKPQPERLPSIQERYEQAQSRYSPSRAVIALIEQPDVPPRGKLLVALFVTAAASIVTLGIRNAQPVAYAALLICAIPIAFLIYKIPEASRRRGEHWPGPPKPRPRRPRKR